MKPRNYVENQLPRSSGQQGARRGQPFWLAALILGLGVTSPDIALGQKATTRQTSTRTPAAQAGLTNDDVVKLVKLDLGDAVVIAKINQAEAIAFKLDTEDLVKLKGQGVSKDVIAAMLKRATPPQSPQPSRALAPAATPASGMGPQAATASKVGSDIRLLSESGETLLRNTVGDVNVVGFAFVKMAYYEIPGTASRVRTSDKNVRVAISADFPPDGYFFLMQLKPDKGNNNRSMKLGSAKQGNFRTRGQGKPDLDEEVACKVEKVSETEWVLQPEKPLKPGEYGVWAAAASQGAQGLYDFGVD